VHGRRTGVEVRRCVIPVQPVVVGVAPVVFRRGDLLRHAHAAKAVVAGTRAGAFGFLGQDVIDHDVGVIVSARTQKRNLEDLVLGAAIFFDEARCRPEPEQVELHEAVRYEFLRTFHVVVDGVKHDTHLVAGLKESFSLDRGAHRVEILDAVFDEITLIWLHGRQTARIEAFLHHLACSL
jgi:hypothetical protein